MFSSLRTISRRGKIKLASWTIFGTLSCIAVAVTYNITAFWYLGTQAWIQGIISAVVLPLIIAAPLFFYLTVKLREVVILNHKLKQMATTDGLTACLNRTAFTAQVDQWLNAAFDGARPEDAALLLIDVDHFKQVNDVFGHVAGDEALRLISHMIRQNVSENDLVGRMGGEEFAVFLPGADRIQAAVVAEQIRLSVNRSPIAPVYGARLVLSVSIGCVPVRPGIAFGEIYKVADRLLYDAKRAGRNQVMMADGEFIIVANDDRPQEKARAR